MVRSLGKHTIQRGDGGLGPKRTSHLEEVAARLPREWVQVTKALPWKGAASAVRELAKRGLVECEIRGEGRHRRLWARAIESTTEKE
ncbi:MAG: hypothetical protein DHS20C21_03000 [Gemmatimonadota bacterium]|nr:MAG: hypothetical protein DHS20C21_03000 [Gemmatimonadota bacterium]